MLIDTHTHLYLPEFSEGGSHAVRRALEAGVNHMLFPNVDLATIEPMRSLHERFPEETSMAMGLHPTEIKDNWRDDLVCVRKELEMHRSDYVAVGEIGIDLYWDKTFADEQMQAFEEQMRWAQEFELPVIIHCRDGLDEVLEVLQAFPCSRGVMHSFGGTPDDVERLRGIADFYFGINGIVTFKNSRLRESLPTIGLDRLLVETDSPYLAPVPHRGKRNESAYITAVVDHIAATFGVAADSVADATTANAGRLFAI